MVWNQQKYTGARKVIAGITGIITIIPLAPLLNRFIPPIMIGTWNFDLVLAVLAAALATYLILRIFSFFILPALLLFVAVILYNQFITGYGFGSMIQDYRSLVRNNWGMKEQKEINLVITPSIFDGPLTRTVKSLQSKVNYKDSVVRNFAVQHSLTHFREY